MISIDMTEKEANAILYAARNLVQCEEQVALLGLYGKYKSAFDTQEYNLAKADKQFKENFEDYRKAMAKWESIKAAPLSRFELERTCELVNDYGIDWVLEAMDITGDNGKCRLGYAITILNNWKTDGRDGDNVQTQKELSVEELLAKWED